MFIVFEVLKSDVSHVLPFTNEGFHIKVFKKRLFNCTFNEFVLLHEKFLQFDWLRAVVFQLYLKYRIYSINRPGRLLNFWTLRVGTYSRWALIRDWALIKLSPFSASEVCLFCNKTRTANNKSRRSNKAKFL